MNRYVVLVVSLLLLAGGCESQRTRLRREAFGKVYYLDGAGNLGFGQDTVPSALRAAGFRGHVENIIWTTFTGPLGDQLIRVNARAHADQLARKIVKYRRRHRDTVLNLIGLSAGTGVAVWAVEALPGGMTVDNMVLLGSSLSNNYDLTKCLKHVKGAVFVVHSPRDGVLAGLVPLTGTIDGQFFTQPAGLVGMKVPARATEQTSTLYREKVRNIQWRHSFQAYGYAGGHTDSTSYRFVKYMIAQRMLGIGHRTSTTAPSHVKLSGRTH